VTRRKAADGATRSQRLMTSSASRSIIEGKRDQLVWKVQERYGIAREEAQYPNRPLPLLSKPTNARDWSRHCAGGSRIRTLGPA
jgi:hypothetical protein